MKSLQGFLRGVCCFVRIHARLPRNNAVEMSQVFRDIARFERFTDLNLFTCKYGFNVIHKNWGTDA